MAANQYLDATGLSFFWGKVKDWLATHYTNQAFAKITTQNSSGTAISNGEITASGIEDTLRLREGTGVTFGVDASAKQITINAAGQVNTIETIKKNGTALTPDSNKAVDITVPTNNNQLTNGAGYQTAAQVASAISTAISSAYIYKGSVADEAALPSSGQTTGDVYNIIAASTYGPAGMNVAWNGSSWDALGSSISVEAISTTTISDIVDQTGDYAPTP